MLGDHEVIRFATAVALASPPAPSPTTATTRFAPGAGVVPDVIVGGLLLGGTDVSPLEKVTDSVAEFVVLEPASLITAYADRVCCPSTQCAVGITKLKGLW